MHIVCPKPKQMLCLAYVYVARINPTRPLAEFRLKRAPRMTAVTLKHIFRDMPFIRDTHIFFHEAAHQMHEMAL